MTIRPTDRKLAEPPTADPTLGTLPRLYVRHTEIHKSVEDGQIERAAELLRETPLLIHSRDSMQQTPLHIASHRGHVELARLLVELGAEINARAYNQFTPLHLARDPAIVELLARNGADLNAVSVFGGTALQEAASNVAHFGRSPKWSQLRDNAKSICAILLARGADYKITSAVLLNDLDRVRILAKRSGSAEMKDAMRLACIYGRTPIVRLLLDNGADPEDVSSGGLTASYFAIEYPQILEMLFDAGADPTVCVNYVGEGRGPQDSTLLHEAAGKGATASVKLLLGHGLSVNAQDGSMNTPLHLAVFGGHREIFELLFDRRASPEIVDLLLDRKADPSIRNHSGSTALAVAADQIRSSREDDEHATNQRAIVKRLRAVTDPPELFAEIALGNSETVEQLVHQSPALVNQPDHSGELPLQRTVALNQGPIVSILLAAGADANRCDESGRTALHSAAFWGVEEMTRTLLAQGADPNLADHSQFTPLHESMRVRSWGVARILIDAGANTSLRDEKDRTPLGILRQDQAARSRAGHDLDAGPVAEIIQLLSNSEDPNAATEPLDDGGGLDLSGQDLCNEDLSCLDGKQGLEWLAINRNPITDQGLKHVAPLTSLRALRIENTKITDKGLVHLQGLKRLEVLSLKGTRITDTGLQHQTGLTKLRHLDLSGTQVTDVGLMQLKGLTKLSELRTDRTQITKKGIAELQQALPSVWLNNDK